MQIENGMVSCAWPYNAQMDDELTPNELAQIYDEHRMTNTRDYIVFDRTGTPHVVVAVKTEIGGDCPQNGNREVEG